MSFSQMVKILREENKEKIVFINAGMFYINMLDAEINTQRIYLRIMYKNRWIDEKKFNVAMEQTYKHGGYTAFLITEPKLRRIEKSKYIDRIVHRWYVNSFMEK